MSHFKHKSIDCHTHLAMNLNNICYFDNAYPSTLLKHMKDNNIRYSLVYATYMDSKNDMSNSDIKHIIEKYSPHLIGVGSVDINNFKETFSSAKSFCIDGFFKAIKLYPTYQSYRLDDPLLNDLYSFCHENIIPLIVHIGICKKTSLKITPKEIERLSLKYPNLTIVIAHFGMPYVKQTLELLSKYRDRPIYVDTSGLRPRAKHDFLRKLLNYYKSLGLSSDRILFGSDFPLSDANIGIDQINRSNLTVEEKRNVFYGNSKKLFRINRPYFKKNFSGKIGEVTIVPLYECNETCPFCFEKELEKTDRQMSLDEFIRIINKVKQENISKIVLFGGEPSLWPYMKEAISIAKKEGVKVVLFTNGTNRFGAMFDADVLCVNLNTVNEAIKKEIENMATEGRISLRGSLAISRHLSAKKIQKILSSVEGYSSISLSLDVTEVDIKENRNNFDKIAQFRNNDKFSLKVSVPSCQLQHHQRLVARSHNNIDEHDCFPGWNSIFIDSNMNIKNCIASDVKMKFDDNISFLECRSILYEDTKKELNELPLKDCYDCFDFRSGLCCGGCKLWKDRVKIKLLST